MTPIELNKVNAARRIIGGANAAYESLDRSDTVTALAPNSAVNFFDGKSIAYGGYFNGTGNPDVLYYGSGSTVKLSTTAGCALANTTAVFPAVQVFDIVLDNNDWHHVYVSDVFARVYFTTARMPATLGGKSPATSPPLARFGPSSFSG